MLAKRQVLSVFFTFALSLTLYANKGNTLSTEDNPTFFTTYWKLVYLLNEEVNSSTMSREAHIIFSPLNKGKGKFQGASGCNAMLGQYEGNEHNLTIDKQHIAMTMMACPHMKIETKFLNALGSVHAWKIESNNLELLDNNRSMIIRFEAISKVK